MPEQNTISNAVIKRLPRYYRHLGELMEQGVERISSGELSKHMNVTASQIRQDLNHFGGFGQQGYGYNVAFLRQEIGKILGLDKQYKVIIIGAGNLGRALANYTNFEKTGFMIAGIFDSNPELKGTKIRGIGVQSMKDLPDFLLKQKVDIAAITVPRDAAREVADELVKSGISAIWNFAHTDLQVPDHVIVESVHLSESLMRISYNLRVKEESTGQKKNRK